MLQFQQCVIYFKIKVISKGSWGRIDWKALAWGVGVLGFSFPAPPFAGSANVDKILISLRTSFVKCWGWRKGSLRTIMSWSWLMQTHGTWLWGFSQLLQLHIQRCCVSGLTLALVWALTLCTWANAANQGFPPHLLPQQPVKHLLPRACAVLMPLNLWFQVYKSVLKGNELSLQTLLNLTQPLFYLTSKWRSLTPSFIYFPQLFLSAFFFLTFLLTLYLSIL